MPLIACFEGSLATRPELLDLDDTTVCQAVIQVPAGGPGQVTGTHTIRAAGHHATQLIDLPIGASLVIIGRMVIIDTDQRPHQGRPVVVLVDAIGRSL